jgi:hypothetical protein
MTGDERCETCGYWVSNTDDEHDDDYGDGTCHRYPPVLNQIAVTRHMHRCDKDVIAATMSSLPWYFPMTDCECWCGEYRPRELDQ